MKQTYHELNSELNFYDSDGKIQFEKDREAAKAYFLEHVNPNTVFFHDHLEKFEYMIENGYYDPLLQDLYTHQEISDLYDFAYSYRFRFPTFVGAYKFYTAYALKTYDGQKYLERYEDRVTIVASWLAQGDASQAKDFITEMITGCYQPATPTFLNAGRRDSGEMVSCFLLRIEDNMESIGRSITNALQLSKRGGGVALLLSNIREAGAPIKNVEGQSSGVIPIMKLLEDSFSYANQLGARQGAGAVYLSALHQDIEAFLDTKRENADEKIRIKTLSLGVVVPDVVMEKARTGDDIALFSAYDIDQEYGLAFADVDWSEMYNEVETNPKIGRRYIQARKLLQTIAQIQLESGYPYILFEDAANRSNWIDGRITHSNLCVTGDSEILTEHGYRNVADLYRTGEDLKVLVDTRTRDMDLTRSGMALEASTPMQRTARNAPVFKVTTVEGYELRCTEWHKFYVERNQELIKIPLTEVQVGDKLLVQSGEGAYGHVNNPDLAYLAGVMAADGTFNRSTGSSGNLNNSAHLYLYGDKTEFVGPVQDAVQRVLAGRGDLVERQSTLTPKFVYGTEQDRAVLCSAPLAKLFAEHGVTANTKTVIPEFVLRGDKETQRQYLSGLFQLDGCITGSETHRSFTIELGSVDHAHLVQVQRLLLNAGVYTRIYANRKTDGTAMLPDGHGGYKEYNQRASWTIRAMDRTARETLYDLVDWKASHRAYWERRCANIKSNTYINHHKFRATVHSITPDGTEDVYDVTVKNGNAVVFNGIGTGQCSEILQVSTASSFYETGEYNQIGQDISCNLGSLNIARAIETGSLDFTVIKAIDALTAVSELSDIRAVPPIRRANATGHSIGLGAMNLHGFLAKNGVEYGSDVALEFTSVFFETVRYWALWASNQHAREKQPFEGFENSGYSDGSALNRYVEFGRNSHSEISPEVLALFGGQQFTIPTRREWESLQVKIMESGLYHRYLMAIPPTGSISYINHSTSSIHPITSEIEIRKEGKLGRVYYPAHGLTNENREFYHDAYELGWKATIDTYAAATPHVDQGLSLTLFFPDSVTTREINRAQIYAWQKGIKTIYYIRVRQAALSGTEIQDCVSCTL